MMRSKSIIPFLILSSVIPALAYAEPASVRTPSPVIHLADNLDEADGLGWCIDTVGRGFSDRLHTHSCKPQGGDVQFRFDAVSGQIQSVAFDNKCVNVETADALRLFDCADVLPQQFSYDATKMRFHPAGDTSQCLTIGAGSRSAGPFMSRDLGIATCSEDAAIYQTWVIAE